jgi:hypothetical protein
MFTRKKTMKFAWECSQGQHLGGSKGRRTGQSEKSKTKIVTTKVKLILQGVLQQE